GASIGLMYALIALGFVLVYKATDAINFAQGEFVMMAGLVAAAVLAIGESMLIAAIVATLAVMIGFGFGLERGVLRPLLGRAGGGGVVGARGGATPRPPSRGGAPPYLLRPRPRRRLPADGRGADRSRTGD